MITILQYKWIQIHIFGCFIYVPMNQWFICYHKYIFFSQSTCWFCPCTWMFWMKTVICCITWMRINFKYLLLLFMQWNRQFHHHFQSSQIRNHKYPSSRHTYSFILQKPQMLLKERNRFWEEGLPYGKQVQEKSKHRIKHMEKCLYGINQLSLIEVIFGLYWLIFMPLNSNCLHLIFYQCWGKRKKKKSIKMKLYENKQNMPVWGNFNFFDITFR